MGENYTVREVIEIYLIGAVMLFTLSVGGTLFMSMFGTHIDLLAPIKALTMYGVFALLLMTYLVHRFTKGLVRQLALGTVVASELSLMTAVGADLVRFMAESRFYSLGNYPFIFKVFSSISISMAVIGSFVVVYYSVDISPDQTL